MLLLMVEFTYYNIKNTNLWYKSIKLDCRYNTYYFYKKNINSFYKFKIISKLTKNIKNFWLYLEKIANRSKHLKILVIIKDLSL